MSRKSQDPLWRPSYRLHKARNLAVVTIDGTNHYLGEFESPESYVKYNAKIAEWTRKQSLAPAAGDASKAVYTCGELAADYLAYALTYYVKNGELTSQVHQVKQALRQLVALCETDPAAEFGPVKLKNLQQHMVMQAKSRGYINKLVDCLKLAFKWAASEELIPATVHHALQTVGGLKKGRTPARETNRVEPVDEAIVERTLTHLSDVLADMVRVQLLTGMRPGEIIRLRPCDVTRRTDGVWAYRPESHKNEHHDKDRCIVIGPKARDVLSPYLLRDAEAYCFSPADSVDQYYAARKANRKSKRTPSQLSRKPKAKPQRAPSVRYTSASYRRAIERACEIAFEMPAELRKPGVTRDASGNVQPEGQAERQERLQKAADWRAVNCWSPNQLRHTTGTRIRSLFGLESAQVVLGHSDAKVTEIYAERDFKKASEVMREIG